MPEHLDLFQTLTGRTVVIDAVAQFVYVGRLASMDDRFLMLEDADVHDLRDSTTTRELYVLDSKRHGVRGNRKRVLIDTSQIASISALDDVVD